MENMVNWDRSVSRVIDFPPQRSIAEKYLKSKQSISEYMGQHSPLFEKATNKMTNIWEKKEE